MTERIRSAAQACVIAQQIEDGDLDGMKHLRDRRQRLGITQKALADRIGVGKVTYQCWEGCKQWPSSIYLPRLAVAMHCTMEELFLPPGEE